MTTLLITRGLPGSGKTTAALAWVAEDPDRRARVGRDVLREHVYMTMPMLPRPAEAELTEIQELMVTFLLTAGRSVIVDDTNLPAQAVTRWDRVAKRTGVRLDVLDFRHVPIDVCIERDEARAAAGGRHVGADVIREIAARGAASFEVAAPVPLVRDGGDS